VTSELLQADSHKQGTTQLMLLSLSEIVTKAAEMKGKEQKIAWLQKHRCVPLLTIFNIMYNKDNVELLIPSSRPPWKKNGYTGVEAMLYNEARRLKIFVRGGGYDQLDKHKRESLFLSLLEDIDDNDAELLVKMIAQKPIKGLPRSVIAAAFPDLQLSDAKDNQQEDTKDEQ
jgi:hypothetical protein